jgi:hypothetical protein
MSQTPTSGSQSPTGAASPAPQPIRLDPCPSRVFSWLEYIPSAPATDHRPACGVLHVRYRYNGTEMEFWPVSEEEARRVMNPGQVHGFSVGSAFSQIIAPYKSKKVLKPGDRQETVKQREQAEKRAGGGKRWLA